MAKKNQHGGARVGAGRKPTYKSQLVTFSVSMPLEAAEWVAQQAEVATDAAGSPISRSRVVVACISDFIRRDKCPKI